MTYEGAIGIDLGTTYSCVGVWQNGRVEIIANDQGNRTTPSYVAFHNNDVLIGDTAKNLATRGVPGVVFDAKRLIGRKFSDSVVQADMKHWPFAVRGGKQGEVVLDVVHRGENLLLEPEQISARILTYLKTCAESYLGKQVTKAVVTVPAYFNDSQRQATKDAGTIAGLEVLRIINEPTAAAIAYGLDKVDDGKERNVLIFDFGGGTFDVSIISLNSGVFEVKATNGDTHLGGQDVDSTIFQYVLSDLKERYGVGRSSLSRKALARLMSRCEQVKRTLSHATTSELVVEGILPRDEEYVLEMSRTKLEELCTKLFARCMSVVQRALRDARMSIANIEDIILVGGSSRIPAVRNRLQELFKGKRLCCSVNPDEAVAVGAAIQANVLSSAPSSLGPGGKPGILLLDVVPLSIGVEVDNGEFDVIIKRNTTIPYSATKEYSTVDDDQREVEVHVFEGERPLTRHNHKLGSFILDGISPAPHGEPTITVTFSVDADGILTVTASEKLANKRKTLVVSNTERLSCAEVNKMVDVARKFSAEDAADVAIMNAVQELKKAFADVEAAIAAVPTPHSDKLQQCSAFAQQGYKWLEQQLPLYKDAREVEAKREKIMRLAQRALSVARHEARAKGIVEDSDDVILEGKVLVGRCEGSNTSRSAPAQERPSKRRRLRNESSSLNK